MRRWRFVLGVSLLLGGCTRLPEADLRQNDLDLETVWKGDTLRIVIHNSLPAPNRFSVRSSRPTLDSLLAQRFPVEVSAFDTLAVDIQVDPAKWDTSGALKTLRRSYTFGALSTPIVPDTLRIPFPRGRRYKIIQGYGGRFSHSGTYSRYALDFSLAVGDTITAPSDGMVVGVIEGYAVGGSSPKYRPYANYITLYHPQSGYFTQYVHLEPQGSFVAVGDSVRRGQALGLSGETGFTSVPHLHFNVIVPDSANGMRSTPVTFEGGIDGRDLKEDVWVHWKNP